MALSDKVKSMVEKLPWPNQVFFNCYYPGVMIVHQPVTPFASAAFPMPDELIDRLYIAAKIPSSSIRIAAEVFPAILYLYTLAIS
jgi:hypothetical protein